MKAPLPPPPSRRARRGTRASQGGAPGQTDSYRPQESRAPDEAQSQPQTRELDTSTPGNIEPKESREEGSAQDETKPTEPQKESSSPEQAATEEKSPFQGQPQSQVAESEDLHESPSEKSASHEDQSQVKDQGAAPESQTVSGASREIPEAPAEEHTPVAEQIKGEDQDSSDRVAGPAAPPSEKNVQPEEATTDDARGDVGDSVHEEPAQVERAIESSGIKGQEPESGDVQERSQNGEGDASTDTPSQSQDQSHGAGAKDVHGSPGSAGQSTDLSADSDHQQDLETREAPSSPEKLATSDVHPTDKPGHEEEPDQSRSHPTADEPTTSDSPAEQGEPQSSEKDDLFQGVTKGGAAEEYVKMAEADSGQEAQLGGDASSMPEQNSSSGKGGFHQQQDEDSSRGIVEPEPAQSATSTADRDISGHNSEAQADERRSSVSETVDHVAQKEESPAQSEHESGQLQSRDIGSHDNDGSHDEPIVDSDQQLQSSSGRQPEVSQSQDSDQPPNSDDQHETPSSLSQDSPDVNSSNDERMQERGPVEHSENENTSTEPAFQPRSLDQAQNPESEDNKPSIDEASLSGKDAGSFRPAEDQQDHHGNEQYGLSLEPEHGQQERSGHDALSGLESDAPSQQGPSSSSSSDPSVPGTSSPEAQLDKEPGDSQETGSTGGHDEGVESHDAPQTSRDDSVSVEKDTSRQSSHDTPNVVEPNNDALPHEAASEQELGDKRSDSGYETGMASSRNLEDSTTTLHDDQHEHQHQPDQEAEQLLASAPSESEQEKPRESRPEQILEGSGKDVSPPTLGGEYQGSDNHPAEETFGLSGSEPIPGTMTHGKDETEDQAKEIGGGHISSQDNGHQHLDDDAATGAAVDDNQRGEVVDEAREKQDLQDPVSHELSQEADHDRTQLDDQSTGHHADNITPADSHNEVTEEQPQQGGSQSVPESLSQGPSREIESSPQASTTADPQVQKSVPSDGQAEQLQQGDSQNVPESLNQAPQGATESIPQASTAVDPQDQRSAPNDGQTQKSHPVEDVKDTISRDTDEPQQDTSAKDDGAGVPASREQLPEPSQISQSPTADDAGSDRFGSWPSQTFGGSVDTNEFSFKKRADSVQVGRSHGPADRGADLPSISTDGPNEDADEGLFAVPPTPRHEMDHDKPSQLQSDGGSKPSSRASSRNGSTGADTLSPNAAGGVQSSHHEESSRELPHEASATKEDVHHETPQSSDHGQQARAGVFETPDSPEEKKAGPKADSEEPSKHEELDRGRSEEPSVTGTESAPHETSAGDEGEQQGREHDIDLPTSPREQPTASETSERHLSESQQPESHSLEQQTSGSPSKTDINEDHNEDMQAGSGNQARDTSGDHDAKTHESANEYDVKQDDHSSNNIGGQTLEPSDDSSQREGTQKDSSPQQTHAQADSPTERESGDSDNRSLGQNDQVQQREASESRPLEEQYSRSVSPEDEQISRGQDSSKQIADPPQLDRSGTQHPDSAPGSEGDQLEQDHVDTDHGTHQPPPDHSSQHLSAQQVNYDGEGYGVTPSSEYSNDPLADSAPQDKSETHPTDDSTYTREPVTHPHDLPDSARSARDDDPMDSGSETFETPLESADFRKSHQDGRSVTSGHFTQALDHLPDESAHTVQGTDDLFDDTDDGDDQDDYGEAVVYQPSYEAAGSSPGAEKTVYSTRGDENNTALGGHRSSLSLGSVGHRSQGSISSMRDTTPVRTTFGSYIGGPSIVRADWAAEHEEELRPPSLNPTPQLGPSTTHDTAEISPFALRNTPMSSHGSDQRGLSSSMWNPERPQTPASASSRSNNPFATPQRQDEPDIDPSLFVPRDVTHGRQDSIPASLHSQTTLDSSWSSPVHSSLPVDRHEPVIRDSWPAPAPGYQQYLSSWSSRPRGDTTSTAGDYDPFKPDNGGAPGGHNAAKPSSSYNPFLQRGRAESSVSAAPSNASNSPSRGSALFAKMRNIFENQSSNAANDVPASPGRTRPVSGVFHPAVSAPRKSQDSLRGQRDDERGGFLNEADHEIDERSAFLRSDGQPSGHLTYNDEH